MIILYILLVYLIVVFLCFLANVDWFIRKHSSSYTRFFVALIGLPLLILLKRFLLINDYIFKL